jgi:hypothetical protein
MLLPLIGDVGSLPPSSGSANGSEGVGGERDMADSLELSWWEARLAM